MGISANALEIRLKEMVQTKQKEVVNDALNKLLSSAKANSPSKSGQLANSWHSEEATIIGEVVEGKVVNTAPYASIVNKRKNFVNEIVKKGGF